MQTKAKKRVLVTISASDEGALRTIARARRQPLAAVASNLLSKALEFEEEQALAELADERRRRKGVTYLSHADAWAALLQ